MNVSTCLLKGRVLIQRNADEVDLSFLEFEEVGEKHSFDQPVNFFCYQQVGRSVSQCPAPGTIAVPFP